MSHEHFAIQFRLMHDKIQFLIMANIKKRRRGGHPRLFAMKDNKSPSGVVRGTEGGVTMCDKRAINYSGLGCDDNH